MRAYGNLVRLFCGCRDTSIAAGESQKTIRQVLKDDEYVEGDEQLTIKPSGSEKLAKSRDRKWNITARTSEIQTKSGHQFLHGNSLVEVSLISLGPKAL